MGNAKTEKRKAQQKRKRERDLAKEAAANVIQDASSWMDAYTVVENVADGNCALWAVFLHALLDGGMDARTARAVLSMKNASPEEWAAWRNFMMLCRERVVDYARRTGQKFYPVNGPGRTEEKLGELFRGGRIRSDGEWELAHLTENSYFCEEGTRLLSELFGLHDARIVQQIGTRLFDVKTALLVHDSSMSNMVLHTTGSTSGGNHFEAIIPKGVMEKTGADSGGRGDRLWVVEFLTGLLKMNFDELVERHSVSLKDAEDDATVVGDADVLCETAGDAETDGETNCEADVAATPEPVGVATEPAPKAVPETGGGEDEAEAVIGQTASPGGDDAGEVCEEKQTTLRLGDWSDDECPHWESVREQLAYLDEDSSDEDPGERYVYATNNPFGVFLDNDGEGGDEAQWDEVGGENEEGQGLAGDPVGEVGEWVPKRCASTPRGRRRTGRRTQQRKKKHVREHRRRRRRQQRRAARHKGSWRIRVRGGAITEGGQDSSGRGGTGVHQRSRRHIRKPDRDGERAAAGVIEHDLGWYKRRRNVEWSSLSEVEIKERLPEGDYEKFERELALEKEQMATAGARTEQPANGRTKQPAHGRTKQPAGVGHKQSANGRKKQPANGRKKQPAVAPVPATRVVSVDSAASMMVEDETMSDGDDGGEGGGTATENKCTSCGEKDNWEEVVRCDKCEASYHIYCMEPAIDHVPEEWTCFKCLKEEIEEGENVRKKGVHRRRADTGRHAPLVKPKDRQQCEDFDRNMAKSKKAEFDIQEERTSPDCRYLTELDMIKAVECLKRKVPIDKSIRQKCEKDDYRLYGIDVKTRVKSRDQSKTGSIIAITMDENIGYNKFRIRWDNDGGFDTYYIDDVLQYAESGQQVVAYSEDVKHFDCFMRKLMVLVCTHGFRFITNNTKIKRRYEPDELNSTEEEAVMELRKYAWDQVKNTKAGDTLNDFEKALLDADKGLQIKIEEVGSSLEMMSLTSTGQISTSLLEKKIKFHPTHVPWVRHFVRGAQAAWRLGRLINMESFMTLACSNELESIPRSIKRTHVEDEKALSRWVEEEVEEYGLATRALRARAKIKNANECHWLPHFPPVRVVPLSRPKLLGDRSPRSLNTNDASPTRRHEHVYIVVSELSKTGEKDRKFFKFLDTAYDPVGKSIKALAQKRETDLARLGESPNKVIQGRMPDHDDEEGTIGFQIVEDLGMRNGVKPFVDKVPGGQETVEMCYDVLHRAAKYNKRRTSEDHFRPKDKQEQIDAIVTEMSQMEGVTTKLLATFSHGLQLADSVTSACLRPEDYVGCVAADSHVIIKKNLEGEKVRKVRAVLPDDFKNRASLQASSTGVVVNHTKDDVVADGYAVMLIVGRPLMRNLLDKKRDEELEKIRAKGGPNKSKRMNEVGRKYRLTDKLCPFLENGQAYDCNQLLDMYQYVGRRALGIPFFGLNILRSVHVTRVMRYCLVNNIDPNHPDMIRLFALARHGDERNKTYDLIKADMAQLNGNSLIHTFRGINSSGEALSESSLNKIPGYSDFEVSNAEARSSTQKDVASSANDRLVRMLEESIQRERESDQRVIDMQSREIVGLKRKLGNSECQPEVPSGSVRESKPYVGEGVRRLGKRQKAGELSELVKKRCDLLREMHPFFVSVAKKVWSEKDHGRFVIVNGVKKNSVAYLLKMARERPTSLLEDRVKEKMMSETAMSADPTLCQRFYGEFESKKGNKKAMIYPLDRDPSCWPTWIED